MDRTTLYRAISPMIRDGWVTSEEGIDARFRTARLTRKGRQILADANKRWKAVQQGVIRRFGQTEYDLLLAELHRLADCATHLEQETR